MDDKEKSKEQLLEEISQLRENYQCYKFLFDNAPLSYVSIDKNGLWDIIISSSSL